MSTTRTSSTATERWTPTEVAALLAALEPLAEPRAPGCAVSVHDRRVEFALDPSAEPAPHRSLVHAGRLVGAVENALRSFGWAPRTVVATHADARPLATISATRRRPATPMDLARRRLDRGPGGGASPRYAAPADLARVVDVAHAAASRGAWLHLLNGPTRDGAPAWRTPAPVPAETLTLDLPWRRDPVLAVCTHTDGVRESVVAGIVVERATVEAALRGLRVEVHTDAFDDPAIRAAALAAAEHETGVGHAALHLHP
ncbi:hypothetical protein [Actinomycetospora cinnamomea]|uniref:Uncharacterized protein n=1 Tax=Actinomycetospora cinnamomea TaxID=663609 RepID=A0A2U1F253_9PSEU|nr:hypothetical protein [Actinomycetospora cinnamomea]PVZ06263.1 hypothetical protein C8D89_1131 [Actinomycetospora cinnamomea]